MRENINKVSQRGERLDSLQDKTDNLAVSAQGFRRGANRVRKQMWWKDMKMRMCIIVGIIILIIVIVVPAGMKLSRLTVLDRVLTEEQSSPRNTTKLTSRLPFCLYWKCDCTMSPWKRECKECCNNGLNITISGAEASPLAFLLHARSLTSSTPSPEAFCEARMV